MAGYEAKRFKVEVRIFTELIILSTQPVEHINFSRKCQGRFAMEVTNFSGLIPFIDIVIKIGKLWYRLTKKSKLSRVSSIFHPQYPSP